MAKFHEIIQHDAVLCLWCDIKHDKKNILLLLQKNIKT